MFFEDGTIVGPAPGLVTAAVTPIPTIERRGGRAVVITPHLAPSLHTPDRGPLHLPPVTDAARQRHLQALTQRGDQLFRGPRADDNVRDLQRMLRAAGYNLGRYGDDGVDGKIGPRTLQALQQFRESLPPTDPRRQALEQAMTRMTPGGRNSWGNNNRVFEALINPTGGVSPLRDALLAGARTLARPDAAPSADLSPDPPRDTPGFRPDEAIL